MIRACILAILLIAASADATGLWLDGREQIASSSSVVTNVVEHFTNGTFTTGTQGWSAPNNPTAFIWDSAGQRMQVTNTADSAILTRITPQFTAATIRLAFTFSVTSAVATMGSFFVLCDDFNEHAGQAKWVLPGTVGTVNYATNIAVTSITTGVDPWVGTQFVFRIASAQDSLVTNGVFFDNFSITDPNNSGVTTNAGSGASGPTFDGRVPLSTNRHTFLNGMRQ